MSNKQIRLGHLIAPFGPGSLYTDRRGIPQVICGLDHWHQRYDPVGGYAQCDDLQEFLIFEPRLAALLHIDQFRAPPDYRAVRRQQQPPPNALLTVPVQRFPTWYRHTATGQLKKFNPDTQKIPPAVGGGRWQPVRFVAVCENGHLNEFPWKEWIGCTCSDDDGLHLLDSGGSELSSIRVQCRSCSEGSEGLRGKSLAGVTKRPNANLGEKSAFEKESIRCPGERPWLGSGARECGCTAPLVGALINQTNLYFPKTISAILIPPAALQDENRAALHNEIQNEPNIGTVRTLWKLGQRDFAVSGIRDALQKRGIAAAESEIGEILEAIFNNAPVGGADIQQPAEPETELLSFRRSEFHMLRQEINDSTRSPDLRVIPASVPAELMPWISKINLVERLRETRVFYGFDRLEARPDSLSSLPNSAMRQLFRSPPESPVEQWLPAVIVFGEGLYFELSEPTIREWQEKNAAWLCERLDEQFISRLAAVEKTLPPPGELSREWASRYLMVHSLAHILINQLVFECGYSTASLRERLFISADPAAPMAGFLIYTASGDAEGTMGGLVRLGRPEHVASLFRRALARAVWCSADPVCSENLGGQGAQLANLAACHACILLPETSCETINHGLDRAMVVGTPEGRDYGFLAPLIATFE